MRKINFKIFVIATGLVIFLISSGASYSNEFSNFYWEQLPQKTKVVLEAKEKIKFEVVSDPKSLDYIIKIQELDLGNLPKELVIDTSQVKALKVYKEGQDYFMKIERVSLFPCEIKAENNRLEILVEGIVSEQKAEAGETKKAEAKESGAVSEEAAVKTEKIIESPKEKEGTIENVKSASILENVSINQEGGANKIVFYADGKIEYKSFVLHNPERIVIDFYNLNLRGRNKEIVSGESEYINKVRVAQFQSSPEKIVRAVIDMKKPIEYDISELKDSIIVNIPLKKSAEEKADSKLEVREKESLIKEEKSEEKPILSQIPKEQSGLQEGSQKEEIQKKEKVAELENDKALFAGEEEKAKKEKIIKALKAQTITTEEKKWEGEPFTFDFKEIDIKDLFRFIADISGLNVVLDPGVSGKITLKLTDVPWDQALDLICRSQGLGYVLEGNVIRIAPLSVLSKEAEERRRQKEQEELLRPLQTIIRPLSYSTAGNVATLVKKMLSPKGTIDVDDRTNTLIITDIDKKIPAIESLINSLDLRIPQVIIEARMVETTRDFSQGLGIQWGFRGIADPSYGNNLPFSFPNTAYIYGNKILSTRGGIAGNPLGGYAVNLPTTQAPNGAILLSTGNVLDTFRLDVALAALENQGKGRVLSNPKIATQNNQQAEIRQGYQIPVQTIANNTVTTTFVNATLSLQVKPQITAEDTIIMDVTVENNRPDFSNVVFGTPPIITQRAKTTLLLDNGSTAVMGGILVGKEEYAQSSVPGVNKIPIIKYLFKNKNITRENRELLIFLTPRIMK